MLRMIRGSQCVGYAALEGSKEVRIYRVSAVYIRGGRRTRVGQAILQIVQIGVVARILTVRASRLVIRVAVVHGLQRILESLALQRFDLLLGPRGCRGIMQCRSHRRAMFDP